MVVVFFVEFVIFFLQNCFNLKEKQLRAWFGTKLILSIFSTEQRSWTICRSHFKWHIIIKLVFLWGSKVGWQLLIRTTEELLIQDRIYWKLVQNFSNASAGTRIILVINKRKNKILSFHINPQIILDMNTQSWDNDKCRNELGTTFSVIQCILASVFFILYLVIYFQPYLLMSPKRSYAPSGSLDFQKFHEN